MEHNEKNQFDKKDSLEIGNQAEISFSELVKKSGWTVEQASPNQDINEHWDYKISKDGVSYLVDTKARKRVSRSDNSVQDEWIWLELHGVREKDNGWIFGGKSDLIAFERKDDFLVVETKALKDLVNKKVGDEFVSTSKEAKYKRYQRNGRHDIITMVQVSDIEEISKFIWKK